MIRMRGVVAAALALIATPALPQTFPKFSGYVVDQANIIPPVDEAALTSKLAALEKDTGRQLAIATIPDLQGYTIEDYGYRLGRNWGVGSEESDDGAILIVAPKERRVRIEVGYGLTPYLTAALSSVIITTQVLPAFKTGDMPRGIVAATDAIIEQLRLPANQARDRVAKANVTTTRRETGGASIGMAFWIIVLFFLLVSFASRRSRGRRYRRGISPVILWGPMFGGGGGSGWGGGGFGGGGFGGGGFGGGGGGFGGGGGGSFGGGGASGGW
jgi:uncharacterized protein